MKKPKKIMTQKKYLEHGGSLCPFCKSADVESGPMEMDGSHAWAKVTCGACDADWDDVFKMVGFDNLRMSVSVKPLSSVE